MASPKEEVEDCFLSSPRSMKKPAAALKADEMNNDNSFDRCELLAKLKDTASLCRLIKTHRQTAMQLEPKNPMPYYLLGRWCIPTADRTWPSSKAAALLFGRPPESSTDETTFGGVGPRRSGTRTRGPASMGL
jgi:hypothetical protein